MRSLTAVSTSPARRRLLRAAGLALLVAVLRPGPATAAPCVTCDTLYASDCSSGLWRIDTRTAAATFIGTLPAFMTDLAVSSDGRLLGLEFTSGAIWEIDACSAAGSLLVQGLAYQSGAGGTLLPRQRRHAPPTSPLALYTQGPPLVRIDLDTLATTVLGGASGSSGAPLWCGDSQLGDLAMDPGNGNLYASIQVPQLKARGDAGCPACVAPSDYRLVQLSHVSGDMLAAVGCFRDRRGQVGYEVRGLAFDSHGQLWGLAGDELYEIDKATARSEPRPLSGGFSCGYGLASLPCGH